MGGAPATLCVIGAFTGPVCCAYERLERERVQHRQRLTTRLAGRQPLFSVNGCCDAMKRDG